MLIHSLYMNLNYEFKHQSINESNTELRMYACAYM